MHAKIWTQALQISACFISAYIDCTACNANWNLKSGYLLQRDKYQNGLF